MPPNNKVNMAAVSSSDQQVKPGITKRHKETGDVFCNWSTGQAWYHRLEWSSRQTISTSDQQDKPGTTERHHDYKFPT